MAVTTQSPRKLREELVETQETIDTAEARKQSLIEELQKVCSHNIIAEYLPDEGEPLRICITCLLEETGWGTGYDQLKGKGEFPRRGGCAIVDHEELRKLRKPQRLVEIKMPEMVDG